MIHKIFILVFTVAFVFSLATCDSEYSEDNGLPLWAWQLTTQKENTVPYPYKIKATLGGSNVIIEFNDENSLDILLDSNKYKLIQSYEEYRKGEALLLYRGGQWEAVGMTITARKDRLHSPNWHRIDFLKGEGISFDNLSSRPDIYKTEEADRKDLYDFLQGSYPKTIVEIKDL